MINLIQLCFQIYQHHNLTIFTRSRMLRDMRLYIIYRYNFFYFYLCASLVIGHTFFRRPELIKKIGGRVGPVFPYRMTDFLSRFRYFQIGSTAFLRGQLVRLSFSIRRSLTEVTGNQRPRFDNLTEQVAKPAKLDLQTAAELEFLSLSRERERARERGGGKRKKGRKSNSRNIADIDMRGIINPPRHSCRGERIQGINPARASSTIDG